MDLAAAQSWSPPPNWKRVVAIDSHTGGEPFRVVIDGLPAIPGDTVLERRRYAKENLDWLRKALMWEPRGHADMYGGWLGPPSREDSDLSVLFLHNEGFSTMCGHGIIALAKVVLDAGILPMEEPTTTIRIDSPAGQIVATAACANGTVDTVSFLNVPAYAFLLDGSVDLNGIGDVGFDIAFGGAFYAYVEAESVGVSLSNTADLISQGRSIKRAVESSVQLEHPDNDDLAFLYGVIFTGDASDSSNHSRNVCVFANGEVDRSPTGTGVSGRLALLHARGQLGVGETITIESIVGSEFEGSVVRETTVGDYRAVVPRIAGRAHVTGRSEFWINPDDQLGRGFLIR